MNRTRATVHVLVLGLLAGGAALPAQIVLPPYEPPNFAKIMITEVSWGEPDGVEITSFTNFTGFFNNYTIVWNDGATVVSQPFGGAIAPGESILLIEPGTVPEAPPGTQIFPVLPARNTTTGPLNVSLRNQSGTVLDEVRISSTAGTNTLSGLGGIFRGLATRGALATSVCVERLWGLDSDGGLDWSEETVRSFGLESRSSGPRGTDSAAAVPLVLITEIDDSPDYLEVYNRGTTSVSMSRWTIIASASQGAAVVTIKPFESAFAPLIAAGSYAVFGNSSSAPAEMPAGTVYVNLSGGPLLSFTSNEYEVGLYDYYGRVIDAVRVTGHDDEVVHNHPRVPSAFDDFLGAVVRAGSFGGGSVGRRSSSFGYLSAGSGASWQPCFTRTMGAVNTDGIGSPGLGSHLDVRLNETAAGGGLAIIINAAPFSAGRAYSFLFSLGHLQGTGPFFGLGSDALANWQVVLATPPFSGVLDARGSARVDLPTGTLPSGFDLDAVFLLQDTAGLYVSRTAILEFDT